LRQKYSPWSLKFVLLALPLGAHFQHEVGDCELALAREALLRQIAGNVGLRVLPVARPQLQVGQTRAPAVARPDVAACVDVHRATADAVLVAVGPGKARAVADLATEFQERVGGRHPFELQPVALELAPEKRLIGQRRVEEIPACWCWSLR
jgi:hypothetical protein